jgi:4-aminobutyrate aminotransferase-like enzyme
MVFGKLFGKSGEPPQPQDAPADEEEGAEDAPEAVDDAEDWSARARRLIPGGASTGSKRADSLYGTHVPGLPTHFTRAAGCHVITTDGDTLVDCTMALGSVSLGYSEPQLTRAVIETIANGVVSGFAPALEVEVAERFCGMIPCAERVLFTKSGAEAMSAAVRLARTYTGRDVVIGCGYFGARARRRGGGERARCRRARAGDRAPAVGGLGKARARAVQPARRGPHLR